MPLRRDRHVGKPHLRMRRPMSTRWRARWDERRCRRRNCLPGHGLMRAGDDPLARFVLGQAHQVDVDDLPQVAVRLVGDDPDRHQLALAATGIQFHRLLPFQPAVIRVTVGFGQHRDGPLGDPARVVHRGEPVPADREVPFLDDHPVAGLVQHPGDPLRLLDVFMRVGDEEIELPRLAVGRLPHRHPPPRPLPVTAARIVTRAHQSVITTAPQARAIINTRLMRD